MWGEMQQIGLKFREETKEVMHLKESFGGC
jgi:hypothetical protein